MYIPETYHGMPNHKYSYKNLVEILQQGFETALNLDFQESEDTYHSFFYCTGDSAKMNA
jgi:hypothetical protein